MPPTFPIAHLNRYFLGLPQKLTWCQQFGRENLFCPKKHLKQPFLGDKYGHHLTLGRSAGQTVDTRSSFGVSLKSLGYNDSNELLGRSVASKLSPQQADELFHQGDTQTREKRKFFSLRPPGRKRKEISVWVLWVK